MNTEPTLTRRQMMNGKPVFTVPVKTVLNLQSGFEHKLLCDGPTFSTGDACAYRCSFCYVPAIYQKLDRVRLLLQAAGLRHEDVVIRREHALDVLRAQLVHPSGKSKFPNPDDRRVIYASPAVDVAANMDLVRETIDACLLILEHTSWQIRLLSKSNLLPKVAEGLMQRTASGPHRVSNGDVLERMIFGVSTGTLDDGVAAVFEEDAPLVSKRIKSLHWLQDHGFRTFGMICPSLPQPDFEAYQKWSREIIAALRPNQLEQIWAEVINLRGESFNRTVAALRIGKFETVARLVEHVSTDTAAWERYNRDTFLAHADALQEHPGKLRYLTYVNDNTRVWWEANRAAGAVLL